MKALPQKNSLKEINTSGILNLILKANFDVYGFSSLMVKTNGKHHHRDKLSHLLCVTTSKKDMLI